MKHPKLLGALLALAVILSACAPAATATPIRIQTLPPAATATESAATAETTGTPSAGTTTTPAAASTGTAVVPVTGSECTTVTVQVSGTVTTGTTTSATATSNTAVPGTPTTTVAGTPTTTGGGTTATGTPSATGSSTAVAGTPTAAAGAATSPTVSGPYLVDCKGMTLYVDMLDVPNGGSTICTGACATVWPPFTISKDVTPSGGDGVTASMLGTITRADGSTQVTYNGWPLYLYSGDKAAGDTTGLSHGDNWKLISPSGDPLK
ncbi:MAG: hypothetical protein ACM3QS_14525 [Bacteroidota bacterium]